MILFQTERLTVQHLELSDEIYFVELLQAKEIIDMVPQELWEIEVVMERFHQHIDQIENPLDYSKNIWGIVEKGKTEVIGLAMLLTDKDENREVGYRFRKPFWGKGFGTEIAKGIIEYAFSELNQEILTAEAWVENPGSNKILSKFMKLDRTVYNEEQNIYDNHYLLDRKDWNL